MLNITNCLVKLVIVFGCNALQRYIPDKSEGRFKYSQLKDSAAMLMGRFA